MNIKVQFFATYADVLGRSAVDIALPEGATVSDLIVSIVQLPGGGSLPPRPLVAVNYEYASPDTRLSYGDEVAVIPPVAGG